LLSSLKFYYLTDAIFYTAASFAYFIGFDILLLIDPNNPPIFTARLNLLELDEFDEN